MAITTPAQRQLLALYRARKDHALNHYTEFFNKVARRYDLYRGFYRGQFQTFRNNIHIPFLFSVIQSDVARKVQASFSSNPLVDFMGYSSDDAAIAKKNATLITAQLDDCHSYEKAVDFYLTGDMYGTAIARDGWKTIRRFEQWRELDEQSRQESIKSGMVTRFDGPNWEVIDILDFWPQPGRARLRDCQWVMCRYFLDFAEIKAMAELGYYDKAAIGDLQAQGMPTDVETSYAMRYPLYRGQQEFEARANEKFARPVELIDMIGFVPDEMVKDGVNFRIVTIANDRQIIKDRPFPFWHGELPFHVYTPMQDPHYLHGMGKIEAVEKLQYLANRFANQKADALDLVIDPMWLVNRSVGVDTQNLYTRAGRVIGVDGPVDESVVRPLSPDMRGLAASYQEIQQLWQYIQQATGVVEDTIMGMSGGTRQTATQWQGRQENVLTRQMLEARIAEKAFVEPLANRFRALNRQFLSVPHQMRILGTEAMIDPITGLPIPQEPVSINLSDINPDYRARAVGASQMLGKAARQQNVMLLLQATASNPVAVQSINWVNFFKYIFHTFDLPNTQDFFVNQVPGINQAAAGAGASPEELVAAAAGTGSDMAPNEMASPTLSNFLFPALEGGTAVGG